MEEEKMQIREMFQRPIDREIDDVIKVGKGDRGNCFQELDEYVITENIGKYMLQFFEAYFKSFDRDTDKIGVWISGFFGSGKSHFMKILSYILQNKKVEDSDGNQREAVSFFMDEVKNPNAVLRQKIKEAAEKCINTDVILFNVDSKSATDSKTNKEAIKDVLMKVFNDHLGYCGSIPFLADFERKIDEDGRYEEFKKRFEEINGSTWIKEREDFYFIQDEIIQTVVELGIMSETEARNWAEHGQESYALSIDKFAENVKKYCQKKGNNHHVVFMVDEIGQYISDDSKLMLNLQTVTEDLGVACNGNAWIIVTSQQDIDSITKVMGEDFSKIQGRFNTRISLTSANVDEVIKKRILLKTEAAKPILNQLYKDSIDDLKNIVTFTEGTPYMAFYHDAEDFIDVYPFIPYQFDLLGKILTSVRQFSSSGKHLADGERTLLKLSQEGTKRYSINVDGILIPLYFFYDPLEQWIDNSKQEVIQKAEKNPKLSDFDVDILKTLFLVKHINNFTRNIENITTLVLTSVTEDRIELGKKVAKSLRVLCDEGLVQKNGDDYVFLTNEEQEAENKIRSIHIDPKDVVTYVAQVVFDEIAVFPNSKYKYNNRYMFGFNQSIDDRTYKSNPGNNIGLHVLTAYSGQKDDTTLGLLALNEKSVVVRLSDDYPYLSETAEMKKIEAFLNDPSSATLTNFDIISTNKRKERNEKAKRIGEYIRFAIESADIFVQSNKVATKSKDVISRISEAFQKLVESQYHKLSAMKSQPTTTDILEVLKANKVTIVEAGMMEDPDTEALNDLGENIRYKESQAAQFSIKGALDEYSKDPYGYTEEDIEFLIAKLYKKGKISLKMNSVVYTPASTTPDEAYKLLTKKEYREKVLLEIKTFPPQQHIKALRDVIKEFLQKTITSDDPDVLMRDYRNFAEIKKTKLSEELLGYTADTKLPGKKILTNGIELIEETLKISDPLSFYKRIFDVSDDFLEINDELGELSSFLEGPQKKKFLHAVMILGIYENSKSFIPDASVKKKADEIKKIISMDKPYGKIPELEKLDNDLDDAITVLLNDGVKEFEPTIYADWRFVKENIISNRPYTERITRSIDSRFGELIDKLNKCVDIAAMHGIPAESNALQQICLDEIQNAENEYQKITEEKEDHQGEKTKEPSKPVVKNKTMSFKKLVNNKSYSIKTEEDVDKVVEEIRVALKEQLEENTIIKLF